MQSYPIIRMQRVDSLTQSVRIIAVLDAQNSATVDDGDTTDSFLLVHTIGAPANTTTCASADFPFGYLGVQRSVKSSRPLGQVIPKLEWNFRYLSTPFAASMSVSEGEYVAGVVVSLFQQYLRPGLYGKPIRASHNNALEILHLPEGSPTQFHYWDRTSTELHPVFGKRLRNICIWLFYVGSQQGRNMKTQKNIVVWIARHSCMDPQPT